MFPRCFAAQPISSIPFGIAFLAGFSIDTLFSMLDRLNKTIENRDAKPTLPPVVKPAPH